MIYCYLVIFRKSSNGKTADFESVNLGSIPSFRVLNILMDCSTFTIKNPKTVLEFLDNILYICLDTRRRLVLEDQVDWLDYKMIRILTPIDGMADPNECRQINTWA